MTRIVGSDFQPQDFDRLGDKLTRKSYRLEDVKDKIEKVAFDVVRFKEDDNLNNLWVVKSTDDGEVIVGMYDDAHPPEKKASVKGWSALPDNKGSEIYVYYNGEPLHRIVISSVGVPNTEASSLSKSITRNLEKNAAYRKSFIATIPLPTQQRFLNKYPELKE